MKTEFVKVLTFVRMVLVLGVQELLQGSWKIPELETKEKILASGS